MADGAGYLQGMGDALAVGAESLRDHPADAALIHRLGAGWCLRNGYLPLRQAGALTLIASPHLTPDRAQREHLFLVLGHFRLIEMDAAACRAVILALAGPGLVVEAEARVPVHQSSRSWNAPRARRQILVVLALLFPFVLLAPMVVFSALCGAVVLSLAANSALRLTAAVAALRHPQRPTAYPPPAHLPVISLFVPLYREKEVANALLTRLARLDYPANRLDLCLIVEDDDPVTQETLQRATLPDHAQIITVPAGTIRTKPRAMNYALNFARGSIIGIYDAEDAPAPDQLRKVASRFATSGPDVACLQGALDYYNSASNWIARCFTLEYALWFRLFLPGIARMGLVVPLGGTTLFLRRSALRVMGGWDAHNVTEDADLGVRLARAGYRTEIIDTVTEEEANARLWPWIKQRSRWLKGYVVTWAVHMRDPAALWRELGPWRFVGFQILFLGSLTQVLLAPILWSFWLVALGVPHPMTMMLPASGVLGLAALFICLDAIHFVLGALAVWRAGKPTLALWAPMLKIYFPLATIAAWIGLLETLHRPFYWHKTTHGVFQPTTAATFTVAPPQPAPHPDATGFQMPG
jgi:cellulose synthase/poly-beta-1,6-N-acetylglucosamine synthase-like glycosyltransferase